MGFQALPQHRIVLQCGLPDNEGRCAFRKQASGLPSTWPSQRLSMAVQGTLRLWDLQCSWKVKSRCNFIAHGRSGRWAVGNGSLSAFIEPALLYEGSLGA